MTAGTRLEEDTVLTKHPAHVFRILAVAAVLASLVLAGCGQPAPGTAPAGKAPDNTAAPNKSSALRVGEAGRTDTFEITVTSSGKASEWTKDPPAGMEYIVVAVQVTNISDEEASISASDFGCVKDADGTRASWENYTGIVTDPETFGAADIAPGETFSGSLIFAIPAEMSATELHYTQGFSAEPDLRFAITK